MIHVKKSSFLNASMVYILVIILTVMAIFMDFAIRVYNAQYNTVIHSLDAEAERIERIMVDIFEHTTFVMKMIIMQITPNYEDLDYINNILSKYRTNPNISHILSWTIFSWANSQNQIVVDGVYGILNNPVDLANHDYMINTMKEPGKLMLGKIVEGPTSRRKIIPAGIGAMSADGEFIGTMTIGFAIENLMDRLKQSTQTSGIHFAIIDYDLNLVLQTSDDVMSIDTMRHIIRTKKLFDKADEFNSKAKNLIYGNNYHFHKLSQYPYILCLHYDKQTITQTLWYVINSRIVEIIVIGIVAVMLIIFIYKREAALRLEAEEAREVAIQASKAKSDFLAYTAHEIKTPLSFIVTSTEIMKKQLFGPLQEKYSEYIAHIHRSGIELTAFIDDLLDEMRTEQGKFTIENTIIDLHDIIADVIMQHADKAEKRQITLDSQIAKELPPLLSDTRRIAQILNNLVSNAIKYSPNNTIVRIMVYQRSNTLHLVVEDQGFGISKKDLTLAFSKYGVIQNQNSDQVESLGLGLPLVKMLVEVLGGELVVDSKKGKGTKISIIFKITQVIN